VGELLVTILAWSGFTLVIASFSFYPVILGVLTKLFATKKEPSIPLEMDLPTVSLLIACYNEGKVIREKINNSLLLDYPKEKLQIIVFSDGSTDDTDSIAKEFATQGVLLIRVEGRKGKTHCQNVAVQSATGDLLVFSDANSMYDANAIIELARYSLQDGVGAVVGHRAYVGAGKAGNKEGLYEKLENWMKAKESLLGGTIGANGAIYAIKKSYFVELPHDRISDINEPLRVAMDHHVRVVYAPHAMAREDHDNPFLKELSRKRRIVLRTMNSLWAERWNLCKHPILATKLIFHKAIRWLTLPFILISAIASVFTDCKLLWLGSFLTILYIALAMLLYLKAQKTAMEELQLGKVQSIVLYSFGVFFSSFLAFTDFLKGKQKVVWESRS